MRKKLFPIVFLLGACLLLSFYGHAQTQTPFPPPDKGGGMGTNGIKPSDSTKVVVSPLLKTVKK